MFGYEVYGIDVFYYQVEIDWELVVEQGVQFVFVKVFEGMIFIDMLFCDSWVAMKVVDIWCGVYYFFRL